MAEHPEVSHVLRAQLAQYVDDLEALRRLPIMQTLVAMISAPLDPARVYPYEKAGDGLAQLILELHQQVGAAQLRARTALELLSLVEGIGDDTPRA